MWKILLVTRCHELNFQGVLFLLKFKLNGYLNIWYLYACAIVLQRRKLYLWQSPLPKHVDHKVGESFCL